VKKLHILLLEDDPLDAELTLARLNAAGIEAEAVRVDKRTPFIEALQSNNFDLILADYSLPSFDGASALELTRQHQPEVPFIFVSGVIGEEKAIESLKQGATDYVLKHRLDRLAPSVHRALREAQAQRERRSAEEALRVLAEASNVLSASLDYNATLSNIARLAVPFFADFCVVDVIADDGAIERVAVAHADPVKQPIAQRLMQFPPARDGLHPLLRSLRTGQPEIMQHVFTDEVLAAAHNDEHIEIHRQLGSSSLMFVPMVAQTRVLGTLTFVRDQSGAVYTTVDLARAQDLARRAALAVDNARLYREAQDANRTKDEFLATISHELRTPLMAIVGWTHMLKYQQLDEATAEKALDTIERNAKAQATLISDILDVSRIVTGKLQLETGPVDLGLVIEAAMESVYPAAQAKNIRLDFHAAPDVDMVLGDADRLQQVIWNLMSNAIKFTPSGGCIRVELEQIEAQVQIRVRDDGQGIDPEFLPYVFDRFRQADGTSTRTHGGLGLGLAIVRHLVELHGGSVQAQSDGDGKGATFIVNLLAYSVAAPARVTAAGTKASEPEQEPVRIELPLLDGLHILVVDDEVDALDMLSLALRTQGAQVTETSSAVDALAAWQANRPDLLISDIAMPGQSGYELLRQIRQMETQNHQLDGQRTPAIALTAYARLEDRERALAAGFQVHAVKPIDATTLLQLVADITRPQPDRSSVSALQAEDENNLTKVL
jgi:signal transduction histidine kinase/AmiR/NasT family two-component response regulator